MALAELNTKRAADEGVLIDILHPKTHSPLGIRIAVCGTDSKTYRDVVRKQQNRRLEAAKKSRGQLQLSAEELEAEALDLLVACTKRWERDAVDEEGKVLAVEQTIELNPGEFLPCTPENVRRLYADPGFSWLRDQVDREIGDRSNFLPG